jgi:hypothetical protein
MWISLHRLGVAPMTASLDFCLGFMGPKAEAEEIKARIHAFLREQLVLKLSTEKTVITSNLRHDLDDPQSARYCGSGTGT